MLTKNFLACRGSYDTLRDDPLSLLAQPVSFIAKALDPTQTVYFVLGATTAGVIGWRAKAVRLDGDVWIRLDTRPGQNWQHVRIGKDYKDWVSIEAKFVPPCSLPDLPLGEELSGIGFGTGVRTTLLKSSAYKGFMGISVKYLRMVCHNEKMLFEGGRPTLEHDLVYEMVKWVLPDLSEAQVAAIMLIRFGKQKKKFESYVTNDLLETVAEVLEENGFQDADDEIKKVEKDVADHDAQTEKIAKTVSKKAKAKASPPLQTIVGHAWTQVVASAFLPVGIPGCSLAKSTVWDLRWRGHYPRGSPPYGTSLTYVDGVSERASLFHCLRWIWDEHRKATGARCPYDLSG